MRKHGSNNTIKTNTASIDSSGDFQWHEAPDFKCALTPSSSSAHFPFEARTSHYSDQQDLNAAALATNTTDQRSKADGDILKDLQGQLQQPKEQQEQLRPHELDWTFLEDNHLFGRDDEIQALEKAFHRRIHHQGENTTEECEAKPELVLVSGNSGTGKSVLVKTVLQKLAHESNGCFLMGKFDQLQTSEPYRPIVATLMQWVTFFETELLQSDIPATRMWACKQKDKILSDVGLEACHVLSALVPALARVLDLHEEKGPHQMHQTHDARQDRLKVALTKFFKVICSPDCPLVLVMDDLQWVSDACSLDLLEALAEDTASKGFMLVGICRSNEVPWHHSFAEMLRRLEDNKGVSIRHIQVKCLAAEATKELLSRVLRQPIDYCHTLADKVYQQTEGNAFLVLQFLQALKDRGILTTAPLKSQDKLDVSQGDYQWVWHENLWALSFSDELDVVALVSHRIKKLDERCQYLLKAAACNGAEFSAYALFAVVDGGIERELNEALKQRQIVELTHCPGTFQFSHDRIQQAAYGLIDQGDRSAWHLHIGRSLLQKLTAKQLEDNLFLVVNQLILAIPLLSTNTDKNGLAGLCTRAGKKASQASNFESSLSYFKIAAALLSDRHWRDEYHLSLDLFSSKAEVECCTADYEEMDFTIEKVLLNSRTSHHKLRARITKIYSLGVSSRFHEAVKLGIEAMASLGETFPANPRLIYLVPELLKVQRKLRSKSDEYLMSLPFIDKADESKTAVMDLFNLVQLHAFCSDRKLYPFIVLRWIRLTLKYGLSEHSCLAFASYGILQCALGNFDEGYRYAMLGLQLFEHRRSRDDLLPRLYFLVYGIVYKWKRPLRDTLPPLQRAISVAADTGDFECVNFTCWTALVHSFIAGDNLSTIEDRLNGFLTLMTRHGPTEGPWLAMTLMKRKLLHDYMGNSNDRLEIEYDMAGSTKSKTAFQYYHCTQATSRMQLAYHFGELDDALENAKESRIAEKVIKPSYSVVSQYLYDGLVCLEAAQRMKSKKWRNECRADRILKKLEKLNRHCAENIQHKVFLLRGELKASKGNLSEALKFFNLAARHAEKQGSIHLQALAHERSGVAQMRLGKSARDTGEAMQNGESIKQNLQTAIRYYREWGATKLVRCLEHKYAEHLS